MNQTLFDECFDNTKDEYYQILKLIEENKDYPKIQCKGRELHHIIPCNYWMSTLKISRYKAEKIDGCKDEDNLISLSYIGHVKMHYFYYKCCKEIINKACIHSFDFMLKTRDVHLKEITESWINEHKQEIEELKEKMSELHSEVAKESNKGRCKYETQENALNAWKNGELSRSRYTEYCRSRGWKIEKLSKRKYNSEIELLEDYKSGKISRNTYVNFCNKYGWKYKKLSELTYEEKYNFNTFDDLLNLYKTNKISKNLFIKICKSENWDYGIIRKPIIYKYENYDSLLNAYQKGEISRYKFLNHCRKRNWSCKLLINRYKSYDELKSKYLNGEITYSQYSNACFKHEWKNEFKKEIKQYSSFEELEKDLNEGKISRVRFTIICNKNNWKYERLNNFKRYANYEEALSALNNNEITRANFTILCNKRGWKFEKFTYKNATQSEVLNGIANGKYMYLSNYKRMCENNNWNCNISEYDNAIIKGLKLGNLKKEDIKKWKSLYDKFI